jgi:hypothetical protein
MTNGGGLTERERDAMSQLRAELAVERKKRELVEAQLLQLLELLAPHLKMTGEEPRERYQALTAYKGLPL